MKKMAIAGLLAAALSLTALSEQRAAANGGEFSFGFSVGFSVSCNWQCQPCCQPCWPSCSSSYAPFSSCPSCAYGNAGSYGDYSAYAYPQAAPVAAPQYNVQNAGYTYPSNPGYGYGSYQAPAYWYGR